MSLHNGYPPGEAIIRSESPLLIQATSTPFYFQPLSRLSGGFEPSGRYFYYTRQNDITMPAEIYRYDTQNLTSEPVCGDCVPYFTPMSHEAEESPYLYDDGQGNTISEADGKNLSVTIRGKTQPVYHGNTGGPSPNTRVYAFLSADCSKLVYFSNRYKQRQIFILHLE